MVTSKDLKTATLLTFTWVISCKSYARLRYFCQR